MDRQAGTGVQDGAAGRVRDSQGAEHALQLAIRALENGVLRIAVLEQTQSLPAQTQYINKERETSSQQLLKAGLSAVELLSDRGVHKLVEQVRVHLLGH